MAIMGTAEMDDFPPCPNQKESKISSIDSPFRGVDLDKYFNISASMMRRNPPDCEESADYPVG
jgi:hypothetical protein